MLQKSILAVALTLTLAAANQALAAPKQNRPVDAYNQTIATPMSEELLFDRAKGYLD